MKYLKKNLNGFFFKSTVKKKKLVNKNFVQNVLKL